MGRIPLSELKPDDLRAWVASQDLPGYRANQVLRWFYRSAAGAFDDMSNLPGRLREALHRDFEFSTLQVAHDSSADHGATRKLLYSAGAGGTVESVLMRYPRTAHSSARTTICVSSQVGCAVGCPFCATGLGGLERNLSGAEIVDQVLELCRRERRLGGQVTHLVYMGMGEPLHNLRATLDSVRRFTDTSALGLSSRRVTVSTSGVVPAIETLAREAGGANLAVSLHAADDGLRDRLVPLNRRWPIADVVRAADSYAGRTGRRVSYEYVMLRGVNDSDQNATDLGQLLHGRLAHVNLIPYNPIPGDPYQSSPSPRIDAFRRQVLAAGVACTVRDTRGRRIDAACGQLRASHATPAAVPAGPNLTAQSGLVR